jgi:hypothetical protein
MQSAHSHSRGLVAAFLGADLFWEALPSHWPYLPVLYVGTQSSSTYSSSA